MVTKPDLLVNFPKDWEEELHTILQSPQFDQLLSFVCDEYSNNEVFPPVNCVFNAFANTPFNSVKLVIIGQDPYHGLGEANGLAFSVNRGVKIPPSLRNIYKEIYNDLNISPPAHGDLSSWARQGVLLLNAVLTVRKDRAASHQKKGWENITDQIIEHLSSQHQHLVFLLWGNYAQQKEALIDSERHLVLKAAHPSPLSAHRGFFGCGHFSAANAYLKNLGKSEIDWKINDWA
jgi:uracil-DNA glycosylase